MSRQFTKETLAKLKSTGSEPQDQLLQRIIWAIHMNEFDLGEQEESIEEDEYGIEFDCTSHYGEFKSIGVTIKLLKKPLGIVGRYAIFIETDEEAFTVGGEYGRRAWNVYQNRIKKQTPKVNEQHLLSLLAELD